MSVEVSLSVTEGGPAADLVTLSSVLDHATPDCISGTPSLLSLRLILF